MDVSDDVEGDLLVPKAVALPFLIKKKKDPADSKFKNFAKMLRSLQVTILFSEVLSKMPAYARYLEDVLARKSIASLSNALEKLKDPSRFTITIGLGNHRYKALCDLGASVSLLPFSIWSKVNMGVLSPVKLRLYMADGSCVIPRGVVEDVLVQIDKFFVPDDFIIVDIEEDENVPIILERPFLATMGAIINVKEGLMTFDIGEEVVEFKFRKYSDPP